MMMNPDIFSQRHIGPTESQVKEMLKVVGVEDIDQLIDETVPSNIRLRNEMKLEQPMSEQEYLEHIQSLGEKNKVF